MKPDHHVPLGIKAAVQTPLRRRSMSLCNYSAPFSPYILRSLWLKENDQFLGAGFYKALEGNTKYSICQPVCYSKHSPPPPPVKKTKVKVTTRRTCCLLEELEMRTLLLLSRFSRVRLCATPQMAARGQYGPTFGFPGSRQTRGYLRPSRRWEDLVTLTSRGRRRLLVAKVSFSHKASEQPIN